MINPSLRVEKWGRLLGYVMFEGVDVGNEMIRNGHATGWDLRTDGKIPSIESILGGFDGS